MRVDGVHPRLRAPPLGRLQRFRGGLVVEAHRRMYHLRVMKGHVGARRRAPTPPRAAPSPSAVHASGPLMVREVRLW